MSEIAAVRVDARAVYSCVCWLGVSARAAVAAAVSTLHNGAVAL